MPKILYKFQCRNDTIDIRMSYVMNGQENEKLEKNE